jgi:hypothetical protein
MTLIGRRPWIDLAIALAAAGTVFLSTSKHGIGASPDSVDYLSAAESLREHSAFLRYDGTPLVLQPPFYSVLLACAGFLAKGHPQIAVRAFQALLLAAVTLLAGRLLRTVNVKSPAIYLVGLVAIAFGPLADLAVVAWSDLLFAFLVLAFIEVSGDISGPSSMRRATRLGMLAGLGMLTRYVGIVLVPLGWWALCTHPLHPNRDNARTGSMRGLLLFSGLALGPLVLWLLRNHQISGTLVGARPAFAHGWTQCLVSACLELARWVLPLPIPWRTPGIALGAALLVFAIAGSSRVVIPGWRRATPRNRDAVIVQLSALLSIAYATLLAALALLRRLDLPDSRLLAPLYVTLWLLAIHTIRLHTNAAPGWRTRWMRAALVVWSVGICLRLASHTATHLTHGAPGYAEDRWQSSATLAACRALDLGRDETVLSNAPDFLWFADRRKAILSPRRASYRSTAAAPDCSEQIGSWPRPISHLVWFDASERSYLYLPADLDARLGLTLERQLQDGAIYRITSLP